MFRQSKFDFEFLFLALPVIAIALIVRFVYIVSIPDLLSPPVAIFAGFIFALLAMIHVVITQGNTLMEVGIGSSFITVILIFAWNSPVKMNQQRQINIMKQQIKQKTNSPRTQVSRAVSFFVESDYSPTNLSNLS